MDDKLIELLQRAAGELRAASALDAAPERIDASIWQDLADELDQAVRDASSDPDTDAGANPLDTMLTGKPVARLTTANGATDLLNNSPCAELMEGDGR